MFSRTGSSIFPQSFQLEMEAYRVQDRITRAEKEYLSNSASSSYINDEKFAQQLPSNSALALGI